MSLGSFTKSALASGLVTPDQLREALQLLRTGEGDSPAPRVEVSDDELADHLVEQGVLTEYQAAQLKTGRTKFKLGAYVVTDWIGQGGMGQVFKAEHSLMGREVAIKVLPISKSTPEAIASFTREIRTQAQLDHPNLVRAYDAGHDGKVYFLVTEYVPGTDLRLLVRTEGKLSMQQAARIIMLAARGLQYAHERGFIHRDVKPGNILVTPDGFAKVSDLGLAGCLHDRDDPRAGRTVGTADYLAPEQIRTPDDLSPACDIYGLGCTLYYAVTGKVPYPGGTAKDKIRRHLEEPPFHPRRFNPELSEEFVEIIADMMEKEPERRVPSAAEVAARLETFAGEADSLPSQQLTRSPWLAAPPPNDEAAELVDVHEVEESHSSAPSQLSQGTSPFSALGEETQPVRPGEQAKPPVRGSLHPKEEPPAPPPLFALKPTNAHQAVMLALAIAVPLSTLFGALLMFVMMLLFRRG